MFQLDFASRIPIYEQIYNNVIKLASAGVLKSGDRLPPVRVMASQLGINPNTVAKAFRTLENDGYIYSTVGRGTFLSDKLSADSAQKIIALNEFKAAAEHACLFNIEKEKLVKIINTVYEGGKNID